MDERTMTEQEHIASLKEWLPDQPPVCIDGTPGLSRWTGFLYNGAPYRFAVRISSHDRIPDADQLLLNQAMWKRAELDKEQAGV